jgi:PAS domain S-box-containing protein
MNIEMFTQRVEAINWRLAQLYRNANVGTLAQPDLLPTAFKELGSASEELQVAAEKLLQQQEELAATHELLQIERQRYQDLFEFVPEAYLVTDVRGVIREANQAAATRLGVKQDFLIGKPLLGLIPPEDRQDFRSQLSQIDQREQIREWKFRLQNHHGASFEATITLATRRNSDGKIVTLRWLVSDICDRQQALKALEKKDHDLCYQKPLETYTKGELIPLNPQAIWIVSQGIVKLSTLCDSGEEVMVGLAVPSMPFGAAMTTLQTYQATALSDVKLASISLTEIAASPHLTQTLLPLINQRLQQTEAFLRIFGQRRVKDRLQALLLFLKREIGQPVPEGTRLSVRLTHEDLASACCTTRVTVTRVLSTLQEQRMIAFDPKSHIILKDLGEV